MRSDFGNCHYGITRRSRELRAAQGGGSTVPGTPRARKSRARQSQGLGRWRERAGHEVTDDSVLEEDGATGGKERGSTAPIHRL